MYKRVYILLLSISYIFITSTSCGEHNNKEKKYNLVLIKKAFKTISVLNNETEEYENENNETSYQIIVGLFTNDSIIVYNNFIESTPILYFLQKSNDKLLLNYQRSSNESDTLVYSLENKNRLISINNNQYYLTSEYFDYLYKEGEDKNNILPLLELLTPSVEDFYNFDVLVNNMWFGRNTEKKLEILNSRIFTDSPHSDMKYKFNVSYLYNNNGDLVSSKKISDDDDVYTDINLLNKTDERYTYKVFHVDNGDRYSENSTFYINTKNLTDSIYTERQQNGYTTTYTSSIILRKEYPINKLNFSKIEIENLISKDIILQKEF